MLKIIRGIKQVQVDLIKGRLITLTLLSFLDHDWVFIFEGVHEFPY